MNTNRNHIHTFFIIAYPSMIQIGCLLVGQTLNITILSPLCCCFFFCCFCCVCLCVWLSSCSKWHSKFNKNYTQAESSRKGKKKKKRERFESKLMFLFCALQATKRQCSVSRTRHGNIEIVPLHLFSGTQHDDIVVFFLLRFILSHSRR
jgi:hypothetical protein